MSDNQSDDGEAIDEDELLAALEQESDEDSLVPEHVSAVYVVAVGKTLESLGEDLMLRIMGMLSVAQLCTLSGPWGYFV